LTRRKRHPVKIQFVSPSDPTPFVCHPSSRLITSQCVLSIHQFVQIWLSGSQSVRLSVRISFHLCVCLASCPFFGLSFGESDRWTVHMSVCRSLSAHLFVFSSVHLTVSPSIRLWLSACLSQSIFLSSVCWVCGEFYEIDSQIDGWGNVSHDSAKRINGKVSG